MWWYAVDTEAIPDSRTLGLSDLKFSGSLPLCSVELSKYFAIACGDDPFRSFKLAIASFTML